MDGKAKAGLGEALKEAAEPALVRSAFDLPAEQRTAIQNALNETFSADIHLRFETAPDQVCGIELTTNGQKVAWSIADYLTSLEKGVGELLKQQEKPEPKAEPKTPVKAEPSTEAKAQAKPTPEEKPAGKNEPESKATTKPEPEAKAKIEPNADSSTKDAAKAKAQVAPKPEPASAATPPVAAKAEPKPEEAKAAPVSS